MGIEDRDWYRDEQRRRTKKTEHFSKSPEPKSWLLIILFCTILLFSLAQFFKHFDRITFRSPFVLSTHQAVKNVEPTVAPLSVAGPSPRILPQQPQAKHVAPIATQVSQEPAVENRPSGGVTIYLCKAYSGGSFWSSAHCGTQQALIDRMATVPNGMPFDQQVQIAEAQRVAAMALYNQQPSAEVQRSDRCGALKREREMIESRYTNWQWQPLEVINPDQTRMKGLRAEQARLGCPTQ